MIGLLNAITTRIASAHAPRVRELRAPSPLSTRAQKLGLYTREDLEREWEAAKEGWSAGRAAPNTAWWHCGICDRDFLAFSGAKKHGAANGHVVIRADWYDALEGEGPR